MLSLLASRAEYLQGKGQVMDPFAQMLNDSIPGFQGSMQDINRNTLNMLRNSGPEGVGLIPEFIRQQTVMGWI
ncbi:hypothetical protein [Dietzia kunjamensis]|uniref:hypothetical protein n=1 Tax=Dietzia kunjamensis TaxID=322509 RepID=UPI0032B0084D